MECIICKEDLLCNGEAVTIPCGHIFHRSCLLKAFTYSSTCPICRKKTLVSQFQIIYLNSTVEKNICIDLTDFENYYILKHDKQIKYLVYIIGIFGVICLISGIMLWFT